MIAWITGSGVGSVLRGVCGLVSRARVLAVYFSFSACASVVGLLTTLFMIRHVAPDEFGRLAITLGALMIANAVIGFGADNLVAINKAKLDAEGYTAFRRSYGHFALMTFAISQVVAVLVWLSGRVDGLVLLVPLMALLKFFVTMASIEYVMEQRAVAYGLVQLLTTVTATAATVVLVLWVSSKAESRIAALMLADGILLAVRYGLSPTVITSWRFDREAFGRIARFGAPLMISVGPAYLLNEADKVVVAQHLDLAAAGIYGAACTIAGFMMTFITALLNASVPKLMAALKEGRKAPLRIAAIYIVKFCSLSIAFAALFLAAYTLAAGHLLSARYTEAIPIVYVLVAMMQWRCAYVIVGTVTDFFGMTTEKLTGLVFAAAVTLGSILLLIPHFGLFGAAFGVGLGYAALAGWLMLALARRPFIPYTV
ncbi:lipopolysaccharide biosynthesis protein [Chromobacterium vaccinii]|uniref:lipopolysaccharide biosynthesis protein n=1 Tax=Chromobacterium vaccinii TaxID=1108595 RepID=UPI000617FC7A|nr:lipopolysaccharide biosynthesis protein [Chromobacterium vaccinii]